MHIHELSDWPKFRYSYETLATVLGTVRHKQGRLLGRMSSMGFAECERAAVETLTSDVTESSKIEGENLNTEQVRSSIARKLGLQYASIRVEQNVDGVVTMVLDATRNYKAPLTHERLFGWHAALFPTGYSDMRKIRVGDYRDDKEGPMQVVSGGRRPKVHFVAPVAPRLSAEMNAFLDWFEHGPEMDMVLKSGIAHLWYVTIHPFEDGNGRIARAIADMALTRSEDSPQRFYSMSAQIKDEQNAYYDMLERTQKSSMDITAWLRWYLECLGRAIDAAQATVDQSLQRAVFWRSLGDMTINERQRKVLNRMLDGNFEGNVTAKKWAALTKSSHDTALRDIKPLIENGVLRSDGKSRNTSYEVILPTASNGLSS